MAPRDPDPVLERHRAEIAVLDRRILEAINARIEQVRQLKAHKEARGLAFHDPDQESRLIQALGAANPGPLSDAGLREIFGLILAWAKREAEGSGR